MLEKIQSQIKNIDDSLGWLKANKKEQYDARFLDLVEERRRLRKIAGALREKPAIAAFGESQKGKSYLIGNLLQKDKKPFTVRSGADGQEVNFVQSINPIGDKKEATGVVTRFTSFEPGSTRHSEKYPVIVKLFSLANLITILADSYYNDILDNESYNETESAEKADLILKRYASRPELPNPAIIEDDVLEIKDYLAKYANSLTRDLRKSNFFENFAKVARRIPAEELRDVVKYLWHEHPVITTRLFDRLFATLRKLNFSAEVYTSLEDVRHYGDNRNTFMSVDCLNELDLEHPERLTDVYISDGDGNFNRVAGIPKCELCALCAETIYKVDDRYLDGRETYAVEQPFGDNGNIPSDSASKLPPFVEKNLLREMDLLDFPGARNRLKIKAEFLNNQADEDGASNSVQMLLRGKVAFLFNNYNDSRTINILLFCHDNEQPAVTDMYNMVDSWVSKYVGADPGQRRATIDRFGGISPLFVVGTKFNIDMIEKDNAEHNNLTSLNQRWEGRFMKVLYTQIFKGDSVKWFNNWDAPGETFKNTYMLRDFKYSGCTGSGNNIYEGYDENAPAPNESRLRLHASFFKDLRDSFIANESVRKFFTDPALSWDVAATRNNDGALFIIDNLTRASRHAVDARLKQFEEEATASVDKVFDIMSTFHVDDDLDKVLFDNIRKAVTIMRELDFTTNTDNYFFGHLLQALMMTETETLSLVHKLIQSSELVSATNDWKEYELIRKRCAEFRDCADETAKWDRLIKVYFFRDRAEAEKYLERRGVEPAILFSGEFKQRSNSSTIADRIVERWHEKISSSAFRNVFTSDSGFDPAALSDLVEGIKAASRILRLADVMRESIAEYVDIVNVANANESLVADLLASKINWFVTDMGYSRLSEEEKENARRIVAKNSLPAFDYMERERKSVYTEEEISDLFDTMQRNPSEMPPSFNNQYYTWLEYMLVSFIAKLEVPDYDKAANDLLESILRRVRG